LKVEDLWVGEAGIEAEKMQKGLIAYRIHFAKLKKKC
jgi:hypothetical protein